MLIQNAVAEEKSDVWRKWRRFIGSPLFRILFVHALQVLILAWIAAHAHFCCDASNYYLPGGRSLLRDGLLWKDDYAGYRFYFTPLVFGVIESALDPFVQSPAQLNGAVPFALAACFSLSTLLASCYVLKNDGIARWTKYSVPFFLNPLVLSIVPYPLQESVFCIFAVPFFFLFLAHDFRRFSFFCAAGGLLVAITLVSRPPLVWVAIPVLMSIGFSAWRRKYSARTYASGALIFAALVLALFAPQAFVNWNTFGTFFPVASETVGNIQISFGVDMLRYGTVDTGAGFIPFPTPSPYNNYPQSEKTIDFYSIHPLAGLFLVLAHMWSSLHFISFNPYSNISELGVATPALLLSSTITACGLLGLFHMLRQRGNSSLAKFLLATLFLSCAANAFTATEARFGLLGFLSLSIGAWQLLLDTDVRKLAIRASPLIVAYVALCVLLNASLLSRSNVVSAPSIAAKSRIARQVVNAVFSTGPVHSHRFFC